MIPAPSVSDVIMRRGHGGLPAPRLVPSPETPDSVLHSTGAHAWVATIADAGAPPLDPRGCRRLRPLRPDTSAASRVLELNWPGRDVDIAWAGHAAAILAGTPHELQGSPRPAWPSGRAEWLLRRYLERGDAFLADIVGEFSVVIWDAAADKVIAARDPLGMQPLFYTIRDGRPAFSPSLAALVRMPGASCPIDPVSLADYLNRTYHLEETVYRGARRVPPGSLLCVSTNRVDVHRYWDPAPAGRPIDWLTEDDAAGFGDVLERAVARAVDAHGTALFLSGGLDSIAVSAVAADLLARQGARAPVALSLGFPAPCDEADVQRRVSGALGIECDLLGFDEAAGPGGLLDRALEMAGSWPAPMFSIWNPLYASLAARGRSRGCRTILTGRGGDEWLTLSPSYAADLIRAGNVSGLWRLISSFHQSYPYSWRAVARRGVWTFGLRPILGDAFARAAPGAWQRHHARKAREQFPAWLAPDPVIRTELDRRAQARRVAVPARDGFYLRDVRHGLMHPLLTYDLEDTTEMASRLGMRIRHPFWDAELASFLVRMPPTLLNKPRRAKWLVRETLSQRFPGLGLERQKKLMATDVFRATLVREAPGVWQRLGGPRRLHELGLVDAKAVTAALPALLASPSATELTRVWEIINLESWARKQTF